MAFNEKSSVFVSARNTNTVKELHEKNQEAEKALAGKEVKKKVKKTLIEVLNEAEFDENDVKTRPGYGNKKIAYIDRYVTVKQLNKLFGMQWSFEITHLEEKIIEGRHIGTTTIGKLTIDTKTLKRSVMDVGYSEGNTPSKSSATDCLKRCSALILPMINNLYQDNN
jgi:recombination DNA repair RAD52 pathway protein